MRATLLTLPGRASAASHARLQAAECPTTMGLPGGCVDGRDHRGRLVRERRRCVAVALAGQGDRHGVMAAGLELGGNVAPDRPV